MTLPVCEPGAPGPVSVFPATRDSETFGYSAGGRPLIVNYCGSPGANLRVLVLAGQHGDEPDAREGAAEFISRFRSGLHCAPVHAAVVVDANPDGAVAETRRNAADIDLNRDHLLLATPEISAVHAFVGVWRPDLIIDVHTYRPWRRELLPYDLVYPQEIMFDFPTHPAVRTAMGHALQRSATEFIGIRMAEADIRCDRYTLIRSGIVRHSTADILDARNNLALRFEVPVVLIEGRRASPDDSMAFAPPQVAVRLAIGAVVDWAAGNALALGKRPSRSAELVPVRCRHSGAKTPRYMDMQSATKGGIARVQLPGSYLPQVKTSKSVLMPFGYAVPRRLEGVLGSLARHRFETAIQAHTTTGEGTEVYRIQAMIPGGEEDAPAMPVCILESADTGLNEYVIFPTRQTGGSLLALLLEPESQFGPPRLPELAGALVPGSVYPVVRVAAG
jgi:hypothetical protein